MKENNYKLSVIIPIYNTEKYLKESINSIINQSIGFNNIELILVNDGSTDNSENICLDYCNKYNNIKYIKQSNQGVSVARNNGADNSQSNYILFLDSDDKMDYNSLESLYNFINSHKELDFVISRVKMFGKNNNWHYGDYRFKNNNTIIDINKDEFIKYNQYHSTGIIIRKSAFLKHKYNHNIKYGEDMDLMTNLLFDNNKFGLVKNSILYYRKREEENAATDKQKQDKKWYLETVDMFLNILSKAKKKYKKIPYYFQYYIMFALRERMNGNLEILNKKEQKQYLDNIKSIINEISPEIIALLKTINTEHLMYYLKLKGEKLNVQIKKEKTKLNNLIVNIDDLRYCAINALEIKNNKLEIILSINTELVDPTDININGKNGELTDFNYRKPPKDLVGKELKYNNIYKYILPISNKYYYIKHKDINLPIYIQNIKRKYPVDIDTKIIYRKNYIMEYNNSVLKVTKTNIINRMIYSIKRKKYELLINKK